jgi:hypothetical protein
MAYKFQMADAILSGTIAPTNDNSFDLGVAGAEWKDLRFDGTAYAGAYSGSAALHNVGAVTLSSTLAATGSITAGTSFIIGSADLNEVDMEKLDGITNGTAAASKALVADANIDIAGLRNVDGTGDLTMGTITMSGFVVDADGDTSIKTLAVDDGETIGCDSDADLMRLSANVLAINGATIVGGAVSGSSTMYAAGNVSTSGNLAASGSFSSAGATITGTSALAVVTATSVSASATIQAVGAMTVGGLLNVSGNFQANGTVVNFPGVAAASLDAADLMLSLDSTTKDMQVRTRTSVVSDMAGTVGNSALAASSGVLSLDIANVTAAAIQSGDTFLFDRGGANRAESIDDVATLFAGVGLSAASAVMALDLNELGAAAVNVANDSIAIIDADDSNNSKKESIADLVSAMAGGGLTATNGVLSTDAGGTPNNIGDASGRLQEGFNYSSVAFGSARTWITPDAPSAGDRVIVKAPSNAHLQALTVSGSGGSKIDGEVTVVMNSPSGSVTLTYLGSDSWAIS